jgi:hypothetical protein
MKQGVLLPTRVKLLLADGHSCYRPRRTGERKRKSVRGCIVGPDIAVLSLVIVKQGEADIPGLTDNVLPKRLGPKRATKIRKFFNLTKEDDVRKYVVRREVKSAKKEDAKPYTKAYDNLHYFHVYMELTRYSSSDLKSNGSLHPCVSSAVVTCTPSSAADWTVKRSRRPSLTLSFKNGWLRRKQRLRLSKHRTTSMYPSFVLFRSGG